MDKLEKIKDYIEEKQIRIKKLKYFNLDEMDRNPDFKEYHHREYLIYYHEDQLLMELLEEIENIKDEK